LTQLFQCGLRNTMTQSIFGCRIQPRMHQQVQCNLISKIQVNLQNDYLQVTINVDSEVELIFKFECIVDAFESSSPLIMSLICSLLM
jgi:hypothetical protein